MACHNHHYHHYCCSDNTNSCCCCCSPAGSAVYLPPSPPCSTADNLLQLLATQLILNPQQQQNQSSRKQHSIDNVYNQSQQQQQQQQQFYVLQSLLDRVSALESQFYSSLQSPHPQPAQRQKPAVRTTRERKSLSDVAAATIQAHFRRYLVRRSHTLRDLHRLATIKSRVAGFRSVISAVDGGDVSAYAAPVTDLIQELHSIQSSDPVIQEGRKSVARELGQIEKFLNKFSAKEVQDYDGNHQQRTHLHSSRSAPKKKVSFVQNAKKSQVPMGADFPFVEQLMKFGNGMKNLELSGDLSGILEDDGEVKEFQELSGEEDEVEEEDSSSRSAESCGKSGVGGRFQGQKRHSGLSAPSPVHMEPRKS